MLQQRALELPMFRVFDGANLNESCELRRVTTVTPQVFALFNSNFVHEQSREMAHRIIREVGNDPERQVERVFQLALQRKPTASEKMEALVFLNQADPSLGSDVVLLKNPEGSQGSSSGEVPQLRRPPGRNPTLSDLCLVIFNLNEFVFPE
jgi:hypothetical protein